MKKTAITQHNTKTTRRNISFYSCVPAKYPKELFRYFGSKNYISHDKIKAYFDSFIYGHLWIKVIQESSDGRSKLVF